MNSVTVIFLFTDIQGSTVRWERNRAAMAAAVRRHDELLNRAIAGARGKVFKTVGDSFCAAFATVPDAIIAAREAQTGLADGDWSEVDGLEVRMAIHAGAVEQRDGDYFGVPLNRVSRLVNIGHGGQVLLSGAAADLAQGALPEDVQVTYIGKHRLRDFEAVEHVYQLHAPGLRAEFPALRSLQDTPHNLPTQLTSFVGRDREVASLRETIDSTRLLSLVGTGGVGKSRLATQLAAHVLDRYYDGVWLVDLSLIRESDAVAAEAASTLKVRAAGSAKVADSIASAVGDKRMLLIFDGCEHVLSAVAALTDSLLHACPNLTAIVTSRQALDIGGESVHHVESLDLEAAVALFLERAKATSSRFAVTPQNTDIVRDVCRRLDGIPLALELAATKIAVLPPKQLLERLNERFRLLTQSGGNRLPRQQTLRALIDWSYDLLDEDERTLFSRMSVFVGGCTPEGAIAVCADDRIDDWRVFELLSSLVSKSLIVMETQDDGQRYRMLNSIRDYAAERLENSGRTHEIAGKHARYFAELMRSSRSLVEDLEDQRWQTLIAPELDNLRALLDRTIVRDRDVEFGLLALSDLEWPELLTTPQEALRWFDGGLERCATFGDAVAKARLLRHHVRLEWMAGRSYAQIRQSSEAALEAAKASGDASEIAYALANLAGCHRDAERFDEADALYEKAFTSDGASPLARNAILRNWAINSLQRGDEERARQRFNEVARLERPGSEAHAGALLNLGELEFAVGNLEAARAAARHAKEIYQSTKSAPLALAVCNLAAYAMAVDDLEEARLLLGEALGLLTHSGARWLFNALEHHALFAGLIGDNDRAAELLGFIEERYRSLEITRQRTERQGYERLRALLSAAYGDEKLEKILDAGKRLTLGQATELAAAISSDTQQPIAQQGR